MRIIVPIKQVPESEDLRYSSETRTLVREGVASVINPFDKRALTEAARLKSLHGGTVAAITMGPPQAREALVECLGRGVDRAVHITDRLFAGSDTLATARVLAAAVRRLPFDLLLLGKRTTDSETGQVGPELAALLGLPQVTGVTSIEVLANEQWLRVAREMDMGFETVECPLPALLTASERLIKPVKTTPELVAEGRRRLDENPGLIETWTAEDLGIFAGEAGLSGSPTWVEELQPAQIDREHHMISGDMENAAEALLAALALRGLRNHRHAAHEGEPPLPSPSPQPNESKNVWSVAEWLPAGPAREIALRAVSFELMSEATRLASQLQSEAVGVLLGNRVEPLAGQLAAHGATRVLLADDSALAPYSVEPYAWILARAIRKYRPWAVLFPATSFGRDLAPRVAAELGLGLTGDCIGLRLDRHGHLQQLKPAFGGQVIAPILSKTTPQMSTVRPGMLQNYSPDQARQAHITRLDLEGLPASRVRVLSITEEGEHGLLLDQARLVACVGTGVGGPEALPAVRLLAGALGDWMGLLPRQVAIAGTRKVVDLGWLPRHQQVGITGRTVAPDLYVALGVRGAFNHLVGMMHSGTIVAVNNDPSAPIFEAADFGIVGDWRAFAAALSQVLSRQRAESAAHS